MLEIQTQNTRKSRFSVLDKKSQKHLRKVQKMNWNWKIGSEMLEIQTQKKRNPQFSVRDKKSQKHSRKVQKMNWTVFISPVSLSPFVEIPCLTYSTLWRLSRFEIGAANGVTQGDFEHVLVLRMVDWLRWSRFESKLPKSECWDFS